VQEKVLATEKAKLLGETAISVREMKVVNLQDHRKLENLDSYVARIQEFLTDSQERLESKFQKTSSETVNYINRPIVTSKEK
jgi:hypothetical protein